jgi:hypothetical protein
MFPSEPPVELARHARTLLASKGSLTPRIRAPLLTARRFSWNNIATGGSGGNIFGLCY